MRTVTVDPFTAGVPPHTWLTDGPEASVQETDQLLVPALRGRRVDMLFQDTPHTEENQRFECGGALAHAGDELLLVDGSGGDAATLESMSAELGGSHHLLSARSREHVYSGTDVAFALFDRPEVKDAHLHGAARAVA